MQINLSEVTSLAQGHISYKMQNKKSSWIWFLEFSHQCSYLEKKMCVCLCVCIHIQCKDVNRDWLKREHSFSGSPHFLCECNGTLHLYSTFTVWSIIKNSILYYSILIKFDLTFIFKRRVEMASNILINYITKHCDIVYRILFFIKMKNIISHFGENYISYFKMRNVDYENRCLSHSLRRDIKYSK